MSDIREESQTTINLAIRIGRLEEAQARQQTQLDNQQRQIDELDKKLDGVATKRQLKLVHDKLDQKIDNVRAELKQEIQEVQGEIRAVEQRVVQHVNLKFNELAGLIKGLAVSRKASETETPPEQNKE